jgi:hypothetical protein
LKIYVYLTDRFVAKYNELIARHFHNIIIIIYNKQNHTSIEKEMGNTAKQRLTLMAAQFKANNNRNNAADGGTGGYGASAGSPGREMRGLLDGDDYDTMELASRKDL